MPYHGEENIVTLMDFNEMLTLGFCLLITLLRFLRSFATTKMNEMRDAAISENGDVGPDGSNLIKIYGEKNDRQMFVAVEKDTSEEIVVGCCAVKRGMDEHNSEPESDIASIWRMSVDESHRGQGIATKLMEACEEYAKTQLECKRMGMWTLNPVAANFYMNRMGYRKEDYMYISDNWVAKLFIPPAFRYEKEL
jgi:ribosomal protein S18 acetylase RimI-like enzyme